MHWKICSRCKKQATVYLQNNSDEIRVKDSKYMGAQWLSGRLLDSRPRGSGFEPHWCHCVVVLEQDTFILALIVLVQPRKTCPCLTERLLMGHKESNQTKDSKYYLLISQQRIFLYSTLLLFTVHLSSKRQW